MYKTTREAVPYSRPRRRGGSNKETCYLIQLASSTKVNYATRATTLQLQQPICLCYFLQGRWQWYGWNGHGQNWFLREKNGITWTLTYTCVIEWPLQVLRCSLGRLRGLILTFSSVQASKVLTRKLS